MGQDSIIPIIAGAFGTVAEDVVGGRDGSEAGGGVWVRAVMVRMVGERECIKLSIYHHFRKDNNDCASCNKPKTSQFVIIIDLDNGFRIGVWMHVCMYVCMYVHTS